ncbi:MAG: serine hydrolase domain-containing protein [Polyangiales bacterium]
MRRRIAIGVGCLVVAAISCDDSALRRRVQDCTPDADERASTHPQAAELDALLAQAVRGGLPGALMAVQEGDRHWYGAAGVPDLAQPERVFESCHITPIKSISKSFVAVRTLQLVQEGQLALDAPLSSLLPGEVLSGLPNVERITVRHLLGHRSGLRHYPEVLGYVTDFLNQPTHAQSRADALDAVRGSDPYFAPGAGFHYSNTNTLLLQAIVEQLTGDTLERALQAAIFEPLGLTRTHLHQDQPLSDHVPMGYMDLYGNGDAHRVDTLDDVSTGAGGIESTLGDVVRFSRALFDDEALLDRAMLDELTTLTEVDEARWGYSRSGLGVQQWQTALGPMFGHTGEDTGYKAYWHYAPQRKLTWVLLLNANYGRFAERARVLREHTLQLLATP